MYHQITDLSDQATCLRDKIYAFSVMIPSIISSTPNDKIQCGVSLMLDDLAADAEALLSNIDELRVHFPEGNG